MCRLALEMRWVRTHMNAVWSATGHSKSGIISQRHDRGQGMAQKRALVISSADQLLEARTRRDFLKVIGVGGVLVMLPSALGACSSDNTTSPPGKTRSESVASAAK